MADISPEQGGEKYAPIDLVPEHGGTLAYTNLMGEVTHAAIDLAALTDIRALALRDDLPIYSAKTIESLVAQTGKMKQAVIEHIEFVDRLKAHRAKFDTAIGLVMHHAIGVSSEVTWLPDVLKTYDVREVKVIADGVPKATVPSIGRVNDLDFYVTNSTPQAQHPHYSFIGFRVLPVQSGQQR